MDYMITVYPDGIEFDKELSAESLGVKHGDIFFAEIKNKTVFLKRIETDGPSRTSK